MNSNLQAMLQQFSIPFMLANYTLTCLKDIDKIHEGDEKKLEQHFENVVSLLGCLDAKDKYLHYFNKMLSKRLLNGDFGGGVSNLYWDSFFVRTVKSQVSIIFFSL